MDSNIKFADGSLLLAQSAKDLQTQFNALHVVNKRFNPEMNITTKTKCIVVERNAVRIAKNKSWFKENG